MDFNHCNFEKKLCIQWGTSFFSLSSFRWFFSFIRCCNSSILLVVAANTLLTFLFLLLKKRNYFALIKLSLIYYLREKTDNCNIIALWHTFRSAFWAILMSAFFLCSSKSFTWNEICYTNNNIAQYLCNTSLTVTAALPHSEIHRTAS